MGIINLTPDSFFPASRHDQKSALICAKQMLANGADILDLGAESTRPGAAAVAAEIQIKRLAPVVTELRRFYSGTIAIDTSDPLVMAACIHAGADMINDVRALRMPGSLELVAKHNIELCLGHMQGEPATMQANINYPACLIPTLMAWCKTTMNMCQAAGIASKRITLDLGFGFGKTLEHNWQLLHQLEQFTCDYKIAVGVSNKSMFKDLGEDRNIPSRVAEAVAALKKASIIRTHDVAATKQAVATINLLGA